MTTSPPHAPSIRRPHGRGSDGSDILLAAATHLRGGWGREAKRKGSDLMHYIHTRKQQQTLNISYSTHPKPGVSQVDSLRLRSEHRGSNELSPMPLIFSAYQHLKTHTSYIHLYTFTHTHTHIQAVKHDQREWTECGCICQCVCVWYNLIRRRVRTENCPQLSSLCQVRSEIKPNLGKP